MVFSSLSFLHLFLPLFFLLYFIVPRKMVMLRNIVLLCFSLTFYFWGEAWRIWIMLFSTIIDYISGLIISKGWKGEIQPLPKDQERSISQKLALVLSISTNLGLLFYFKYFNFFVDNFAATMGQLGLDNSSLLGFAEIALPLGISFYTFQSMSYTIDVYKGETAATRKFFNFAAFVTMFPQLVAGPIVRYKQIADELVERTHSFDNFSLGVQRFIIGLAKKIVIANLVAQAADGIFALPSNHLSFALAWVGIIAYTLQIYFDFSAYSDMAIGLGLMLGFHFPENFLHPYSAKSIKEFWRRWHVSLSSWFRDYLYIPLGGGRRGRLGTFVNLWIVFLLCGFWHGASWNFVIWGVYHGAFLIIERLGLDKALQKTPNIVQHTYTLLVAMVGWVFFRAETLDSALNFLATMFGFGLEISYPRYVSEFASAPVALAMIVGILTAGGGLTRWARNQRNRLQAGEMTRNAAIAWNVGSLAFAVLCIYLSMIHLAGGSYNPFIYFRF